MSIDGKIASPSGKQVRISSEEDMKRVYQLRHSVDAIIVGIGTVLNDDPKLTIKEKYVEHPHHPIRIVLDTFCRTPVDALVVNEKAKTIIFKGENQPRSKKFNDNVKILSAPAQNGMIDMQNSLVQLSKQGIKTLLVEGGGTVIWQFIKNGYFDDVFVYIGSLIIGGKNTPSMAMGKGFELEKEFTRLQLIDVKRLGDGILLHYHPR
jgi:2,5-diamino-6-(ribosylamino)-4(3H)-pyrimidinone 5'-phosphate reductase